MLQNYINIKFEHGFAYAVLPDLEFNYVLYYAMEYVIISISYNVLF